MYTATHNTRHIVYLDEILGHLDEALLLLLFGHLARPLEAQLLALHYGRGAGQRAGR